MKFKINGQMIDDYDLKNSMAAYLQFLKDMLDIFMSKIWIKCSSFSEWIFLKNVENLNEFLINLR